MSEKADGDLQARHTSRESGLMVQVGGDRPEPARRRTGVFRQPLPDTMACP